MTRNARIATWGAAAMTAFTLLPAADAMSAPIVSSVTIQGSATVGSTLRATAVTTDPTVAIQYRWQRCSGDTRDSCNRIPGALDAPVYVVGAADEGQRLAVRAVSVIDGDKDAKWSSLTGPVTVAAAPMPTPTPTPTPPPEPVSDPEPEPVDVPSTFDQTFAPAAPTSAASAPVTSRYLRPFPVVRVKGRLVAGGARITLLRVKAPAAAKLDVRCTGPRCHLRRRSTGGGRIAVLERFLRAGTRVTIRVAKPGTIGKYVRLVIRDGSAPKRRDACLAPGGAEPVACPPA